MSLCYMNQIYYWDNGSLNFNASIIKTEKNTKKILKASKEIGKKHSLHIVFWLL